MPTARTERMDWRSMFVYDPATKLVRLAGGAKYAPEMWARRANYRAWLHGNSPLGKCGGCRRPATRRDAFDVADVCDFCGEASDESLRVMNERDAREAAREAHGDYLRDEGKDFHGRR